MMRSPSHRRNCKRWCRTGDEEPTHTKCEQDNRFDQRQGKHAKLLPRRTSDPWQLPRVTQTVTCRLTMTTALHRAPDAPYAEGDRKRGKPRRESCLKRCASHDAHHARDESRQNSELEENISAVSPAPIRDATRKERSNVCCNDRVRTVATNTHRTRQRDEDDRTDAPPENAITFHAPADQRPTRISNRGILSHSNRRLVTWPSRELSRGKRAFRAFLLWGWRDDQFASRVGESISLTGIGVRCLFFQRHALTGLPRA